MVVIMSITNLPAEIRIDSLKYLSVDELDAYSRLSKEALNDVEFFCQSTLVQNLGLSRNKLSIIDARKHYFSIARVAKNVLGATNEYFAAFVNSSEDQKLAAIINAGDFSLLRLIKGEDLREKAMYKAIELGNLDAVKYIHKNMGTDIDATLEGFPSVLECALSIWNREIFDYFWTEGANRDALLGATVPFGAAARMNHTPLAKWLLENGHQPDMHECSMIADTIKQGDYTFIDLAMDYGSNMENVMRYLNKDQIAALSEHRLPFMNQVLEGLAVSVALISAVTYILG